MSFHNPRMPWSELEGTLSGAKKDERHLHPVVDPIAVDGDGGDSPAWSRKRQPYQAPALVRRGKTTPEAGIYFPPKFNFLHRGRHPEGIPRGSARPGVARAAATHHHRLYRGV